MGKESINSKLGFEKFLLIFILLLINHTTWFGIDSITCFDCQGRDGLLNQFLQRNKTSVVVDTRIGEWSSAAEEDKIARRVAAEKSKQYSKVGRAKLSCWSCNLTSSLFEA